MKIMDMDSGKYIEDGFGDFAEEVLNAQWLPQQPALQLGLQESSPASAADHDRVLDAEAFLRNVYLSQE